MARIELDIAHAYRANPRQDSDYALLPLSAVAGKTRTMEPEFISASGTDVTDAFRMYLRPLLGSAFPDAFRLRPNPVAKVLRP